MGFFTSRLPTSIVRGLIGYPGTVGKAALAAPVCGCAARIAAAVVAEIVVSAGRETARFEVEERPAQRKALNCIVWRSGGRADV